MHWRCWLGGRKGIWPVKQSGEVLAWFSVWSEVQMIIIWSSLCHCHPSSLTSLKYRMVLPFWCRLTQTVLEKRPLHGWSVVVVINDDLLHKHGWTVWENTSLYKTNFNNILKSIMICINDRDTFYLEYLDYLGWFWFFPNRDKCCTHFGMEEATLPSCQISLHGCRDPTFITGWASTTAHKIPWLYQ